MNKREMNNEIIAMLIERGLAVPMYEATLFERDDDGARVLEGYVETHPKLGPINARITTSAITEFALMGTGEEAPDIEAIEGLDLPDLLDAINCIPLVKTENTIYLLLSLVDAEDHSKAEDKDKWSWNNE